MESLPTGYGGGGGLSFGVAGAVTDTQAFSSTASSRCSQYTVDDTEIIGDTTTIPRRRRRSSRPRQRQRRARRRRISAVRSCGFSTRTRSPTSRRRASTAPSSSKTARLQFGVETRAMEMSQKGSEAYFPNGDWGVANPGEMPDDLVQNFCGSCEFDDFNIARRVAHRLQGRYRSASRSGRRRPTAFDPVASTDYRDFHTVEEDTQAVYFQFGLNGEFAGRPVQHVDRCALREDRRHVDLADVVADPDPLAGQQRLLHRS